MRAQVVASAPARVDLAGGTLDIWPLSVLVPGAVTVNLAIELRARVRIAPRPDGRVAIASADRGARILRELPLDGRATDGPLSLLERLAAAFDPPGGLTLTSRAAAPAGAGLGGSSALAIATGAALAAYHGVRMGRERLLRRVMNVEALEIGVPTGTQDYLAALHGGLSAYRHGVDATRRERLRLPEGLERRLVLAYTGQPRQSGFSNWEMFRRFVDGERETVERLEAIARIAREMADALRAGDLDRAGRLLGEEGRLRYGLAPTVETAALRRVGRAALAAGALGVKVCGAGGGGCLVALAAERAEGRVARAMVAAGARLLRVRAAPEGVRVSVRRARA